MFLQQLLVDLGRDLRAVLAAREENAGTILREILQLPKRIVPLSERVARQVLRMPFAGGISSCFDHGSGRESVAQGGGSDQKTE